MSTTDELLEQLEAEVLSSSDDRFIVDNNLRTITIPGSITVLGVEHDDDVHRLYFQLPKMYGEFDLSEFDIRINYVNAAGNPDMYPVDDKEASGDNITFSWLVGRTAFEKMGDVKFNICLRKTDGDGVVIKEFNTTIAILPPVLEGLETTELIVQQNPDIIESILQRLGVLEESGGSGGTKDYSDLENKPQLNGVTLEGNKSLDDIGAQPKGNYLTTESDPTVPSWAKNPTKPSYTATEVGADASGTAESKVSAHNTADDAHNDIRLLVQQLTTRLNALADSDDDTLDQMSEIVAYIKSNKSLIDGITTGKVNVSDIINNLTTNAPNKPLSAAQGVALKAMIEDNLVNMESTTNKVTEIGEDPTDVQYPSAKAVKTLVDTIDAKPKDFITTLTYSEGTYIADHTLTEIETAYNNGSDCFCVFDSIKMELISLTSGTSITFQNNNLGSINTVMIQSDGAVTRQVTTQTPTETSLGMVLAGEKTDADTVPVRASSDGKLWSKETNYGVSVSEQTTYSEIVNHTITSEEANPYSITFTSELYPEMEKFNEFLIEIADSDNTSEPYWRLYLNNLRIGENGGGLMGLAFCRASIHGKIASARYSAWMNTSLKGTDSTNVSTYEKLRPVILTDPIIKKIKIESHTNNWLDEGSTIKIWGWLR